MVPNWKRPKTRDYITDILDAPPTDEDFEMINYFEELERKEKAINEFLKYLERCFRECPAGDARMTYYRVIKDLKTFLS